MDEADPAEVVAEVLDVFRRAHQEATEAFNTIDPDAAFEATNTLDDQLQALLNEQMTRLKARQAVRIRRKHKLSLAGLALRTNRSRASAARYVRIDRETSTAPTEEETRAPAQ